MICSLKKKECPGNDVIEESVDSRGRGGEKIIQVTALSLTEEKEKGRRTRQTSCSQKKRKKVSGHPFHEEKEIRWRDLRKKEGRR